METRIGSLFSKAVSFAFLTSTLVSESLGRPKSRGKGRSRRRIRAVGTVGNGAAALGKLAP